jgi:ADP-heptose:LPS heptosyltransferase
MSKRIKIGIFRALYLGDLLCIIPTVRALRAHFADAHIVLIGLHWQQSFVTRFQKYFDEFMEFPGWHDLPEQPYDPMKTRAFLKEMHRRHFNVILQMQGNGLGTNLLCLTMGADMVCGLRKEGDLLPDARFFPVSNDDDHEVTRFLKLTDVMGVPRKGVELEFPIAEAEAHRGQKILTQLSLTRGNYVCLHPGARDPRRRLAASYFARLCDKFATAGLDVVLTGSLEESAILQRVRESASSPCFDLVQQCGHVGLGELAFILDQSCVLICNDTGVSHIAAARGIPSVVLFSEHSAPSRWAPLNRSLHRIISAERRTDVEAIWEQAIDVMQRHAKV